MEILPQFASTTRVDDQGNWSFETPASVTPGFHQVIIQDDEGNEESFPLYIAEGEKIFVVDKQTETVWLDRVQTIFPPAFAYAFVGLTVLLILATLFLIWLSKRRSRRTAISSVIAIIVIAAAGALYLNRNVGVPSMEFVENQDQQGQIVDIRGTIQAPFQNQPVSGVDLTLGDTSIKTEASGQYVFPKARIGDVIRINHPALKRAIGWRITEGGTVVIPFDADLYYALDNALEVQFGRLNDQIIVLSGVKRDEQAKTITIEVEKNGKTEKTFQYVNGGWILMMQ